MADTPLNEALKRLRKESINTVAKKARKNFFKQSRAVLLQQTTKTVLDLSFYENSLLDEDINNLGQVLKKNTVTITLNLQDNPDITDKGAEILLKALQKNKTLQSVNLDGCSGITVEGKKIFQEKLAQKFDPKTPNFLQRMWQRFLSIFHKPVVINEPDNIQLVQVGQNIAPVAEELLEGLFPPALEELEIEGIDTEQAVKDREQARSKYEKAKSKYERVLKKEFEFRARLSKPFSKDWKKYEASNKRQEQAYKSFEKEQRDLDDFYKAQLESVGFYEKIKVKEAADKASDLQYDADENAKTIAQVPLAQAKVSNLEAEYLNAHKIKVELDAIPKEKRNPKLKVQYFKLNLQIIELTYKLLEAKAEASEAALFANVAQEHEKRMAYKAAGRTSEESDSLILGQRKELQADYAAAQEKLDKGIKEYGSAKLKALQDLEKAEAFLEKEIERIRAKRAAQNEVSPPLLASVDIQPVPADIEQETHALEEESEHKPAKGP